MDRKTRSYFKKEFTRRTAAAQWIDVLLLFLLVVAAAYGWLFFRIKNAAVAAGLSVIAALMVLTAWKLFESVQFEKFVKTHSQKLRQEALLEYLMLLPVQQMQELLLQADGRGKSLRAITLCEDGFWEKTAPDCKSLCVLIQQPPEEPVSAVQMLEYCRRAARQGCDCVHLYSTAPAEIRAKELAEKMEIEVIWHPPEELLFLAQMQGILPEEDAVTQKVRQTMELRQQRRKAARQTAFERGTAKRYLICAGILIAASWITGYRFYYLLISAFCLCLALVSWWKNRESSGTSKELKQ